VEVVGATYFSLKALQIPGNITKAKLLSLSISPTNWVNHNVIILDSRTNYAI
jgi:hypothetical protein